MLNKPAIGFAVAAVGVSVYIKYRGFPDLQQEPANVQAQLQQAASMRTSEPMVLILGYLLFAITAAAFMFEMGHSFFCAVKRYRWKPAELPPLQPLSEEERQAAAAAAAASEALEQQQQQQQARQQQVRQQQPSPTDHDERRRRALEALQREHDEKAAAAREQQKQQEAERAARRAAAAAEAAAKAAAETASQHASAAAAASHWERWEAAMVQQYGGAATQANNSNNNAANAPAGSADATPAAAAAAAVAAMTPQQQAELDASRLVRQQQDAEYQASLAADAQKRKERETAGLLKNLKAALAAALPPEAAANADSSDTTGAASSSAMMTLAIRVRLPDGSNAVRQFAGTQSFADVLDWVYSLPGMPLLQPGAWGLASSFPRRQLAAAAGLWAAFENSAVNIGVNFLEECIEAGSSLGRAREGAGYEAAPAGALSLCIRPLVGEAFSVQVTQGSRILEVKRQVEQQTGLLPEDQRLIFAGQVLDDQQTLQHYKITSQHTVQLAPRAGASSRASSSSGGGGATAAAAQEEMPEAAAAAAAGDESSGLLVVSTVAQLREEVANGAAQLALYVVEN